MQCIFYLTLINNKTVKNTINTVIVRKQLSIGVFVQIIQKRISVITNYHLNRLYIQDPMLLLQN